MTLDRLQAHYGFTRMPFGRALAPGMSDLEREAQLRAIEQITDAATGTDELTRLAEDNTSAMLNGLFSSLGFTGVTITFDKLGR